MLEDEPRRRFRRLLIRHEGLRLKPYRDSVGKLTIGVGRNLDDRGITQLEAMLLLSNDMDLVHKECFEAFAWFKSIGVVRQDVVLSMVFNLGISRFMGFTQMLKAVSCQDYDRAADEMLASKWAGQVGDRAIELATMMRTGYYPAWVNTG